MSHSYPSDISHEQFDKISSFLESARKKTRPRSIDLYDVFCAILYLLKSGCQWRSCYHYFCIWSKKADSSSESILEKVLKKIGWRGPTKQWSERKYELSHR